MWSDTYLQLISLQRLGRRGTRVEAGKKQIGNYYSVHLRGRTRVAEFGPRNPTYKLMEEEKGFGDGLYFGGEENA